MRDATIIYTDYIKTIPYISIHASHARCDFRSEYVDFAASAISIHASHAGCDLRSASSLARLISAFQSTHPMRDATFISFHPAMCSLFQSTHPMRDATIFLNSKLQTFFISIHATHAGCDSNAGWCSLHFLISIHASHAGCDLPM